jgi:uncharacterized protein
MKQRAFFLTAALLSSIIVFSTLYSPAATCAVEPSYDCSKTKGTVEQLICSDNELAELDNLLAGAYRTALHNFPDEQKKNVKVIQLDWINTRNNCRKEKDMHDCVRHAYETRIAELQIQGGNIVVPEPVKYKCNSGTYDNLTAYFYTKTILPAVVLSGNTGKDFWQETVYIIPSGSGAKYRGNGVMFWSKGTEAMVERKNNTINCIELDN